MTINSLKAGFLGAVLAVGIGLVSACSAPTGTEGSSASVPSPHVEASNMYLPYTGWMYLP
jgi:hypothetical protein